jgi:3-dehydroquinate dehydratase/shikimate dehydrogenase
MNEPRSKTGISILHRPMPGTARVSASPTAAVTAVVASRGDATALHRLPSTVAAVEVRADLAGDLDPQRLREKFSGQLIYSLRSAGYGGRCADRDATRRVRLLAAARGYDVVDLEADRDLAAEVLTDIPDHRRRVSWYGGPTAPHHLLVRFAQMSRVAARLYLLAPRADSFTSAMAPLRLLTSLRRQDVTAFATGPAGGWTRILAAWLAAPVVFGSLSPPGDELAADALLGDAPTVGQLLNDYPFPALPPVRALYGIVGRSFHTNMFLRRQNAGYRKLRMPYLFLPFIVPDGTTFRTRFWPAVAHPGTDELGTPLRGLTVAAPYKGIALDAGQPDPDARRVQAANLLLRRADGWMGTNTDGGAVMTALHRAGATGQADNLDGSAAAVVGCGGAGRAAAVALANAGARVTLVNRSEARGRLAARLLGFEFVPLSRLDPGRYRVVANATPVHEDLPFDVRGLPDDATVVDFVCAARTTALVSAARNRGLTAIDGREVLAGELAHQFQLMTGRPMPVVPDTGTAPVTGLLQGSGVR